MNRLKAFLLAQPQVLASLIVALCVFIGAGAVLLGQSCSGKPPTPAQYAAVEHDLCKARAAYKLVAIAAGGALDPAPGSARAELEAAEDALCASLPAGGQ